MRKPLDLLAIESHTQLNRTSIYRYGSSISNQNILVDLDMILKSSHYDTPFIALLRYFFSDFGWTLHEFCFQELPAVILANHGEKEADFLDINIVREATSSQVRHCGLA